MKFLSRFFLLVITLNPFSMISVAHAQSFKPTVVTGSGEAVDDVSSPHGAIVAFQKFARYGEYAAAAELLDFGSKRLSFEEKREAARKFIVALTERLAIDASKVSKNVTGDIEDGLKPNIERVAAIELDNELIPIELQRFTREGLYVWKFSYQTVEKLIDVYDSEHFSVLLSKIPKPLVELRFLSIDLWQWIAMLVFLLLAYGSTWLVLPIVRFVCEKLVSRAEANDQQKKDYGIRIITVIIEHSRYFFAILLFYAAIHSLHLSVRAKDFMDLLALSLLIPITTSIIFTVINATCDWIAHRSIEVENRAANAVVPLARKTIKVIVVLTAVGMLLHGFGVNVSALIAGLGIGDLAVALAAQKTIENFFGGITLIMDHPIKIGDFCKFGAASGIVENIGIRSTRVRTADRSVITVPNGDFSQMQIENLGDRDAIKLQFELSIRYDTQPDQVRTVLSNLRTMLKSHPMVSPEGLRVRFIKIGIHGLSVEVFCYIKTRDSEEFLAAQEDILLSAMDLVAAAGTALALPAQTIQVEKPRLKTPQMA